MSKRFEGGLQILVLVSAVVLAALWPLDPPATGAEQEPAAAEAQQMPAAPPPLETPPSPAVPEAEPVTPAPEAQPAPAAEPAAEQPAAEPEPPPAVGGKGGNAARGRVAYRLYCASCHGAAGKGDGSVARYLKMPPADLTRLSRAHEGRFPTDRVYAAIDGRQPVPGHGASDMPVWGMSFQDPGKVADQEVEVRHKIRDLVVFLESIQGAKGSR